MESSIFPLKFYCECPMLLFFKNRFLVFVSYFIIMYQLFPIVECFHLVCKIWKVHKNIREEVSHLCHTTTSLQREMPVSPRNCIVHCSRWAKPQIGSRATVVWSEGRHFPSEHSGAPVCLRRESVLWTSLAPARS